MELIGVRAIKLIQMPDRLKQAQFIVKIGVAKAGVTIDSVL